MAASAGRADSCPVGGAGGGSYGDGVSVAAKLGPRFVGGCPSWGWLVKEQLKGNHTFVGCPYLDTSPIMLNFEVDQI